MSKRISSKGRGRQRLFPLTEEMLGPRGITTTDLRGILLGILGILVCRWSVQCSRSPSIRSLRRLSLSPTSNSQTNGGWPCQTQSESLLPVSLGSRAYHQGGKLRKFMHQPSRQGSQVGSTYQKESISRLSLGTINVIFATPGRSRGSSYGVTSIVRPDTEALFGCSIIHHPNIITNHSSPCNSSLITQTNPTLFGN